MSAPLARRLLALRLNGLVSLEGSCSQSPANLPCAAHRAGIACIRPMGEGRQYSQKADDKQDPKQPKTDEAGSERASTSGRGDDEEPSQSGGAAAAADARKRAAAAAALAQVRLKAAAASAASFTSGVAQELYKQSFGKAGAAAGGETTTQGGTGTGSAQTGTEGASDTAGKGTASAGSFASSAYQRAQEAYRHASGSKSGSGPGAAADGADAPTGTFLSRMQGEIRDAVLPASNLPSVMRRRKDAGATEVKPGEGPSELAAIEQEMTVLEKLAARFGANPVFQRMSVLQKRVNESNAAKRAQQLREDVRERLETSDSEVVNRMADMRESMRTESESAITYREIRSRHPAFDMPTFLKSIKNDVPLVIKAYLEGNEAELKEFCSKTMLERLMGIYNVTKAEGQISDSTILEYSDVDMVDMKMLDGDPVVILHFSCQQINCIRDIYGNVVSGSPEEVNRVYYYWAVQQDGYGMVTREGKYIPPRWMLSEMLLRGMHQLL